MPGTGHPRVHSAHADAARGGQFGRGAAVKIPAQQKGAVLGGQAAEHIFQFQRKIFVRRVARQTLQLLRAARRAGARGPAHRVNGAVARHGGNPGPKTVLPVKPPRVLPNGQQGFGQNVVRVQPRRMPPHHGVQKPAVFAHKLFRRVRLAPRQGRRQRLFCLVRMHRFHLLPFFFL